MQKENLKKIWFSIPSALSNELVSFYTWKHSFVSFRAHSNNMFIEWQINLFLFGRYFSTMFDVTPRIKGKSWDRSIISHLNHEEAFNPSSTDRVFGNRVFIATAVFLHIYWAAPMFPFYSDAVESCTDVQFTSCAGVIPGLTMCIPLSCAAFVSILLRDFDSKL